jgi:pimeloyl-ACP methyl ester carboxylesterase
MMSAVVELYHEVHGEGEPLILVHGSLGGVQSWTAQLPALAETYRFYFFEERGRGHTPDVPGPFHYEDMAADTIAFIERVVGAPAHLVGASDGGIISLLIGLRRPDVVRRMVVIGANFHHNAIIKDSGWSDLDPNAPWLDGPRERYAAVSPDGAEHWPEIVRKVTEMGNTEPELTATDMAGISVPVLVMAGDDDAMRLEHEVELYEALPQGQLAIVPGSSHLCFMEKPDLVNRLILDFLAEDLPPQTMLPVRRQTAASEVRTGDDEHDR